MRDNLEVQKSEMGGVWPVDTHMQRVTSASWPCDATCTCAWLSSLRVIALHKPSRFSPNSAEAMLSHTCSIMIQVPVGAAAIDCF
jgi:hypothetical protein